MLFVKYAARQKGGQQVEPALQIVLTNVCDVRKIVHPSTGRAVPNKAGNTDVAQPLWVEQHFCGEHELQLFCSMRIRFSPLQLLHNFIHNLPIGLRILQPGRKAF